MKRKNVLTAWLVVFLMAASMLPGATLAEGYFEEFHPQMSWSPYSVLYLTRTTAAQGQTATVQLRIRDNPGFAGFYMRLSFSDYLTLTGYTINFPDHYEVMRTFAPPVPGNEDTFMGWAGSETNIYVNDLLVTLTFAVSEDAETGAFLPVEIVFENAEGPDIPTNMHFDILDIRIVNGGVRVRSCDDEGCEECYPPICATPIITAYNAPNGAAGVFYSFQFAATGNPSPTWSHTELPPGLSLSGSGLLSGTPSETGTFTFTVTVTNQEGEDYREITIEISLPPNSALTLTRTAAAQGQTATVQLRMRDNPGFSSMLMRLSFSEYLTLTGHTLGRPGLLENIQAGFAYPILGNEDTFMGWMQRKDNIYVNDLLVTLYFAVSEDAETGAFLPVEIAFENALGSKTKSQQTPTTKTSLSA